MAKKLTNFDIVNYVHLSYANALKDNKNSRKAGLTVNGKAKTNYKILENRFISELGVTSEKFIMVAKNYSQVLYNIAKMFQCNSIKEMKDFISPEKLSQLNLGEKSSEGLLASAKAIGYMELLGKVYTGQDSAVMQDLLNIANSFDGLNLYKENLEYLKRSNGKDPKKQAMTLALLEKAFENASIARNLGESDVLLDASFNWQESAYDNFHKTMQQFKEAMSKGLPLKTEEINKIITQCRRIMNMEIKGKALSKYNAAVISSHMGKIVERSIKTEINKTVKNTKKKTITIPIAEVLNGRSSNLIVNLQEPVNAVAKSIQNFGSKEKRISLSIGYQGTPKTLGVITKQYKSSTKRMDLMTNMSIGQALAIISKNGMGVTPNSQFYNAFNFFLLGRTYSTKNRGNVIDVVQGDSVSNFTQIDAAFGGIMSKFFLDVLAEILSPNLAAFISINGELIPTPVYYKFLMKNLIKASQENAISSYITFNAQDFINNTEPLILDSNITGAKIPEVDKRRASWRTGYDYDIAALKRNLIVKENILNHKINIRGDILNISEYKNLLN